MNKVIKSIAVVGCGWLGLPYAKRMIENAWRVKGTTTQNEKLAMLTNVGIEPYLLNIHDGTPIDSTLFDAEYLLINVPPGRTNSEGLKKYPSEINRLLEAAKKRTSIKKIVYISSTSVYGKSQNLIDEQTATSAESDAGKAILGAEEFVRKSSIPNVILRFGGLAGPGRHPGRFLAGRSGLTSGNQSVNFLHLEDAIGVVRHMFDHQVEIGVYNVVAPMHPTKKDFYTKMATSIDLMPPSFVKSLDPIRREVSVHKLLEETGYTFRYPNPLDFSF